MSEIETPQTTQPAHKLSALEIDQMNHSTEDIAALYRMYVEKRILEQMRFYESRIRENENNAGFTFAAGALIMTISSLIATISASRPEPILTVMSAILPAFAALFGAFRQLYGWERQANLYRDALLGLEKVRLLTPDDDRVSVSSLTDLYPKLVAASETVFTSEVNQWGQFVLDKDKGEAETAEKDPFNRLVANLNLSEDQVSAIERIMSASRTPGTSTTTSVKTTTDVKVETPLPVDETIDAAAPGDRLVAQLTEMGETAATSQVVSAADEAVPLPESLPEIPPLESFLVDGQSNGVQPVKAPEELTEPDKGVG